MNIIPARVYDLKGNLIPAPKGSADRISTKYGGLGTTTASKHRFWVNWARFCNYELIIVVLGAIFQGKTM